MKDLIALIYCTSVIGLTLFAVIWGITHNNLQQMWTDYSLIFTPIWSVFCSIIGNYYNKLKK